MTATFAADPGPLTPPPPDLEHDGSGHRHADDHEGPHADLGEHVLERDADHVAEQRVADAPADAAQHVPEEERPVAQPAHAGQARDDRPGEGDEPAEEDGRTPVPLEEPEGGADAPSCPAADDGW